MANSRATADRDARNNARQGVIPVFAARLRELAGERTPGDIARSTGLGHGTITRLLEGATDPRLSTMLILINEFDLRSLEELLTPFGTAQALKTLQRTQSG